MKRRWFQLTAFVSGLLFGLGLGLAGMGQPGKVLAFLDVAGDWDPTLAIVIASAIAVHFGFARGALRRSAPLLDAKFVRPSGDAVDRTLVIGAAVFGVGWGLQGYCPGPAVLASAGLDPTTLVFLASMVAGLWLARRTKLDGRDRDGDRLTPLAPALRPAHPRPSATTS